MKVRLRRHRVTSSSSTFFFHPSPFLDKILKRRPYRPILGTQGAEETWTEWEKSLAFFPSFSLFFFLRRCPTEGLQLFFFLFLGGLLFTFCYPVFWNKGIRQINRCKESKWTLFYFSYLMRFSSWKKESNIWFTGVSL